MHTSTIKRESRSDEWLSGPDLTGFMGKPIGLEPATSDVTGRLFCPLQYRGFIEKMYLYLMEADCLYIWGTCSNVVIYSHLFERIRTRSTNSCVFKIQGLFRSA